MKRWLWIVALAGVLLAPPAFACNGIPVAEEEVSVAETTVGLTSATYLSGIIERCAIIQVKTAAVYFRLDSTTATVDSTDYNGYPGDIIVTEFPSRFRAIRSGSISATVKVTYFTR